MREPKNQMLGTMEPPLMQLSVKEVLLLYETAGLQNPRDRGTAGPKKNWPPQKIFKTEKKKNSEKNENVNIS